tara:strand:+ start:257 stop:493 length:237 start_codon:yes stop_codon:yes gene_type:complete
MPETIYLKVHAGDEIDALIAYVIAQMQSDIEMGHEELLYDFLSRMPRHYLIGYLGKERGDEALARGIITEAEHYDNIL